MMMISNKIIKTADGTLKKSSDMITNKEDAKAPNGNAPKFLKY
jgi:hypothetical protein